MKVVTEDSRFELQDKEKGWELEVQEEQQSSFFDQHFLADVKALWEHEAKEGERVQEKIASLLSEAGEEEVPYYLRHFFDQWKEEDVDMEYILKIWSAFSDYVSEVEKVVNEYTTSFSYQQMDVIDQSLFLLGYTEWKVLGTAKEILINEMIELAKRYSDEGAPRLVNGVMDKVLFC